MYLAHLADAVETVRLVIAAAEASPGEPALLLVEAQRLGPDAGAVGGLGPDARSVLRATCCGVRWRFGRGWIGYRSSVRVVLEVFVASSGIYRVPSFDGLHARILTRTASSLPSVVLLSPRASTSNRRVGLFIFVSASGKGAVMDIFTHQPGGCCSKLQAALLPSRFQLVGRPCSLLILLAPKRWGGS